MSPEDFQDELDKRAAEQKAEQDKTQQIGAVQQSGDKVVNALKGHTEELTGSIHNLLMATMVSKDPKIAETAKNLAALLGEIKNAANGIKGTNLGELSKSLDGLQTTLQTVPAQIEAAHQATDPTPLLKNIAATLGKKDFNPKVNVTSPAVDLSPLTKLLTDIKTAVSSDKEVDTSKLEDLTQEVATAVNDVKSAIQNQTFPVPNYVLPFKDSNGKATQVQLDASGNIPTTGGGGGGGGTSSSFNATFPATGTAVGATDGTNMQPLKVDGSDNLLIKVNTALPAGTNVIGHVVTDTGSTTAVTGTVTISGTVTANAGTNLNTSVLALDTSVNGLLVAQASTTSGQSGPLIQTATTTAAPTYTTAKTNPLSTTTAGALRVDGSAVTQPVSISGNQAINLVQVAGASIAQGHGTAATAIRVELPTDGTGVVGLAAGSAVIGHVITDSGSVTNATLSAETTKVIGVTRTADGAGNLLTSNSSTFSSKFALDTNLLGTLGTAFSTAGKVDVKAADGDVFVRQATAANLNATVTQGTAAAVTAGWPIIGGEKADTTGTFTNATQTTSITATSLDGYQSVTVSINGTYGTATAVFEGSDDGGTTWYALQGSRTDTAIVENGYTSLTNTTRMWGMEITGLDQFRVRSTAVASGTVNVRITVSSFPTTDAGVVSIGTALPTGSNTIGALTANQSVNVAQINGVTPLMGNGTTGTGAQRVTLSSDNTAVANWGQGATGSAVPSGAGYGGLLAKTANPSAASDGNLVGALSDKLGKQVVVGSIRDLKGNQFTTITSSTSETTVVTAVASTFLDVYGCIVENTSATASKVTFKDSTAGTTQFEIYVPAGDTRGFMLPESGAFKQTTVNTNWTATCGTSVASIVISMLYVKNI